MKHTIVSQEVKTFYTVEIKFMDVWTLFNDDDFLNHSSYEILYPKLYSKVKDLGGLKTKNEATLIITNDFAIWQRDLVNYLSKKLGFYGLYHCGGYDANKKCVYFTAYNRGDTINR